MLRIELENYLENLVRMVIKNADRPATTMIWPKLYKSELMRGSGEWGLYKRDAPKGVAAANVSVVKTRVWGEKENEWQACVSAGGIIWVLTNEDKKKEMPVENSFYMLVMF
jgi:hypothetical protein